MNADNQNIKPPIISQQPDSFLKPLLARFFIGGVTLWALGEILTDIGHRYLFSKEAALQYAKELRYDGRNILTESEISFWTFIQGLSTVPRIWWREITATALMIAFIQIARKMLLEKSSAVPKVTI